MHQNLLKTKLINKNCVFELLWIKSNLIHQAIKNFIVCETIKTNYVLRVRVVLRNLLLQETDDRCMNNTFLHFTRMQRYFAYNYGCKLQSTTQCEIYVKEGPSSKECSKHLVCSVLSLGLTSDPFVLSHLALKQIFLNKYLIYIQNCIILFYLSTRHNIHLIQKIFAMMHSIFSMIFEFLWESKKCQSIN